MKTERNSVWDHHLRVSFFGPQNNDCGRLKQKAIFPNCGAVRFGRGRIETVMLSFWFPFLITVLQVRMASQPLPGENLK